jgi:hypothetical protein
VGPTPVFLEHRHQLGDELVHAALLLGEGEFEGDLVATWEEEARSRKWRGGSREGTTSRISQRSFKHARAVARVRQDRFSSRALQA